MSVILWTIQSFRGLRIIWKTNNKEKLNLFSPLKSLSETPKQFLNYSETNLLTTDNLVTPLRIPAIIKIVTRVPQQNTHCLRLRVQLIIYSTEQSARIFPFLAVLTPTRPSLVMAATKLELKTLPLEAKELTVVLDLVSVKRIWSEVKRPFPCWRFR